MKKNSLIWFRNNLRVHDNAILNKAQETENNIIGVYCFDPRHYELTDYGFKKTEKFRAKFLIESITDLKENLSKLNITLLTYIEKPESIIPTLVDRYHVDEIILQKESTKEEVEVVENVREQVSENISILELYDQFLYHPDDIQMEIENIPKVFTDFRKHLEKKCNVRKIEIDPRKLNPNIKIEITSIPTLNDLGFKNFEIHIDSAFPFKGGESSTLERLQDYFFETKKLAKYKETRNELIGTDYSSKFSAWLANGSISARTIYWEVMRFEKEQFSNDSTYWLIFELMWRDYFKYISLKYGNKIFRIGGIQNRDYKWNTNSKSIEHWQQGKTQEPFVNANMIELNKTGWMSNRGRQNVASYFAKTQELDWRVGASYFEALLIDYDVHSNYGNWMYVAGVGNDPRNRTFNVKLQSEHYDEHGTYQNLWIEKRREK